MTVARDWERARNKEWGGENVGRVSACVLIAVRGSADAQSSRSRECTVVRPGLPSDRLVTWEFWELGGALGQAVIRVVQFKLC